MDLPITIRLKANSTDAVTFGESEIHYRGVHLRNREIIGIASWTGTVQSSLSERSTGWVRLLGRTGEITIKASAWKFGRGSFEKLEGFMKALSIAKKLFIPSITQYWLKVIFTNGGSLAVKNLIIDKEGVKSKTLLGERLCPWEWMPRAEVISQDGGWKKHFAPALQFWTEISIFFYSPKDGKKIELARLKASDLNGEIAMEIIRRCGRTIKP